MEELLIKIKERKQMYEEELEIEVGGARREELRNRISELRWMEEVIRKEK